MLSFQDCKIIEHSTSKMYSSKGGTKNEDKIIRTPNLDFVPDPRGLGYVFFTHMQKYKDNVAQIDGQTGEKDSYGSLLQRCIRTAITMRLEGVKPGDIITLCSFNHFDSVVPFISSLFVGAISASLDPTLTLTDMIYLLKQVTPKLIFTQPEAVEMIQKAVEEASSKTRIVVFGNIPKYTPFANFLQPRPEENNFKLFEIKNLRDTAIIFFSSGTSGLPKGVCISHFAFLNQIGMFLNINHCTKITLAYASLYWISTAIFWGACILKGTARIILPYFNVNIVWETIDKYKPTFMFLAPSQLLAMCNHGRPNGVTTNNLNSVMVGGGSILEQQMLNARKILLGTIVCLGYGLTEASGVLTCFTISNPEDLVLIADKPTSTGRGLPGITYKVVDSETEEILGPNQQGELRVKTNTQLNGYHSLDSSDVWDSEGWLKTGDIVYYDEDFCFYVVDRIKEMLKFQSWHVPPALIENVLLTYPAIKAAVVIGIPHDIDGDHPMAVVVLKEEFVNKNITPKEIVKFVEERVHDRQRLRGGVKIVDKLSMTPSGKVKRGEVKNMILKK